MTTPRVTVPVEDLAGKLKAIRDKFLMPTPDKDFTDYAVMTRCIDALSAAPAPEGGAVNHEALAKVGYEASCNKKWEWASRGCKIGWIDAVKAIIAALATREEASEPSAEWFGVTGAADETEALAVALFAVRCPGVRMTDEDLHHYRSAAQRAMQVVSAELSGNPGQLEAPAEAGEDGLVLGIATAGGKHFVTINHEIVGNGFMTRAAAHDR